VASHAAKSGVSEPETTFFGEAIFIITLKI
jgi:hypothetical protein